jgi:hypothetical protein
MRIRRKHTSSTATQNCEAHSTYTAGLGALDRGRYRRTPAVAPTVADLVRPGDTVSTSYGTGGVVIEVKECRTSPSSICRLTGRQSIAMPTGTGSTNASPSVTAS